MYTIKIFKDDALIKEFNNEKDDACAFGWILRHQGQSVDYCLRWGGYKVEVIDEETNESEFWKPYCS